VDPLPAVAFDDRWADLHAAVVRMKCPGRQEGSLDEVSAAPVLPASAGETFGTLTSRAFRSAGRSAGPITVGSTGKPRNVAGPSTQPMLNGPDQTGGSVGGRCG
jgi:hypothetical protein